MISIIIPAYNEQEMLPIAYEEIKKILAELDAEHEFIFIDDGSKDDTYKVIENLVAQGNTDVKGISFSRNFGKEAAIYAGFEKAKGDYVVMMDADMQDPPSLLPELFKYIDEGYDSVATRRVSRKGEPVIRSFFARAF